jgi:hypothetical protein
MALTAKQRNALPRSAFAYAPKSAPRSKWRYPVPTAAQAKRAGISAKQNLGLNRNARSRAAQRATMGTKAHVSRISNKRTTNIGKRARTRQR